MGTSAHLLGFHILDNIPDEVQDYQLRIQHNRTCITSYAPYQLKAKGTAEGSIVLKQPD